MRAEVTLGCGEPFGLPRPKAQKSFGRRDTLRVPPFALSKALLDRFLAAFVAAIGPSKRYGVFRGAF